MQRVQVDRLAMHDLAYGGVLVQSSQTVGSLIRVYNWWSFSGERPVTVTPDSHSITWKSVSPYSHSVTWQSQCHLTVTVSPDSHSVTWQSQCHLKVSVILYIVTVSPDSHSVTWQWQCHLTVTVTSDSDSVTWQSQCHLTVTCLGHLGWHDTDTNNPFSVSTPKVAKAISHVSLSLALSPTIVANVNTP